ncbi:T-box transcription factor TBX6-like [Microplitis mediator]|uniref:T-box transcription factor TBX6-like n=1 Tax=Microplitis mediator TaxID=375433 RepID=UPI002554F0A7|nr:T-box transcription factor TBX6-like [Microplitis mediator]
MAFLYGPPIGLNFEVIERMKLEHIMNNVPQLSKNVAVTLQRKELWKEFNSNTTEMVITKQGRRMYPGVEICVVGLEPMAYYCIMLEIEPASNNRYKYVTNESQNGSGSKVKTGRWITSGNGELQPPIDRRIVVHPDSPATGDHWMREAVSFSKIKITNNTDDRQNNILLCSMHKYHVKIWIIQSPHTSPMALFTHPSSKFIFNETEFIAVTAYQNTTIKIIKIDNNPFAKGFRQNGKRKSGEIAHVNREDEGSDDEEIKRATKDDSGISSNGASPPPVMQEEENQVKLHRPWLDSSSPSTPNLPPHLPPQLPPVPQMPSTSTGVLPPNPFIPTYENGYTATVLVPPPVPAFPHNYPAGYLGTFPWYR